jgi:hypothetical protein
MSPQPPQVAASGHGTSSGALRSSMSAAFEETTLLADMDSDSTSRVLLSRLTHLDPSCKSLSCTRELYCNTCLAICTACEFCGCCLDWQNRYRYHVGPETRIPT